MYNGSLPWVSNPVAQEILAYTQVAYPIVLLLFYLVVFTIHSIVTAARNDNDKKTTSQQPEQLGPGGKPLPKKNAKEPVIPRAQEFSRPRRLLFEWLSLGVIATIAVVIVHALVEREARWWCGQAPTVS